MDIYHFPLLASLSCGFISMLWLIPGLYNYRWLVTSFESSIEKKETQMIYIDSVIPFSVFSELLWKSTLLVCYKLNWFIWIICLSYSKLNYITKPFKIPIPRGYDAIRNVDYKNCRHRTKQNLYHQTRWKTRISSNFSSPCQ